MGRISEETSREVLCHELIEEGQGHDVNVQSVGYLNDLVEITIFQLLKEELAHFHEHVVVDVLSLLLVKPQFHSTDKSALG